jgi:hypothetical protein
MEPVKRCPLCGSRLPIQPRLDDKQFDRFMIESHGKYKPWWYEWRRYRGGAERFIQEKNIRNGRGIPVNRAYFVYEIKRELKRVLGIHGGSEIIKISRLKRTHIQKER